MWTHYANENKGCCIAVQVTTKTWEQIDVDYSTSLPAITSSTSHKDVLKTKADMWKYEEETRFLSPLISHGRRRPQLSVKITRIFLGCNLSKTQKNLLTKIIKALDDTIEVIPMHKDYLNYGYK